MIDPILRKNVSDWNGNIFDQTREMIKDEINKVIRGIVDLQTSKVAPIAVPRQWRTITLAVDPPAMTLGQTVRVSLSFPGSTFTTNALVVPKAPTALEANLAVGGFIVTGADAGDLCLTALAIIDGSSRTWTFFIFEP